MDEKIWLEQVSEKIKKKMLTVTEKSKGKVPYTTKDGVFDDRYAIDNCWWTNGFWGGLMWQMYHATGEKVYRETAQWLEEKMDVNLMSSKGMDHDSGLNGFRLPWQITDCMVMMNQRTGPCWQQII